MIVTDGIHIAASTGLRELHDFAALVGIKRCWFHYSKKFPHYNKPKHVPCTKLIEHGAHLVHSRVIVSVLQGAQRAAKCFN